MIWKNFWIYKTIHSEGFEKGGLWRKRRDFGLEVYLYCREKQGKIKSIYWCGGYSYSIRGWWLVLRKEFDISQFDKYREDNRREVKRANGGLPVSLWDTYSSFANCYGGVII